MRRAVMVLQTFTLDTGLHFDDSGNMEMKDAVEALSALAQETRLKVYRLLIEAGPDGVPAGRIGDLLDLPPATLSFHLAHLSRAGLARSKQAGRFVIYTADFDVMNALVGYLTENCCGGSRSCAPTAKPILVKGRKHEAIPRSRRRA
jgi:DNA-binding transcriptional ArsR family regulator